MFQKLMALIWRVTPPFLCRWGIRQVQTRFTVSAGAVVFDVDGRVLLLQHRFRIGSGLGIPGGFIGRDEQPEAALRRELREETGLVLTGVELLLARTTGKHLEIIFIARADGAMVLSDWEIASAEWCDPANLPAELNKGQRKLIERALAFVAASSI